VLVFVFSPKNVAFLQDSNTEIALLYYVALEEGSAASLTPEYDSSGRPHFGTLSRNQVGSRSQER
jgi:hypothetical protein